MTPEQRERVINMLIKFGAYPLRDRTNEELMTLLQAGEALRNEIDPLPLMSTCKKSGEVKHKIQQRTTKEPK